MCCRTGLSFRRITVGLNFVTVGAFLFENSKSSVPGGGAKHDTDIKPQTIVRLQEDTSTTAYTSRKSNIRGIHDENHHRNQPARCDSNAGTACPLGGGGGGNAHSEDDEVGNPAPAGPRSTPLPNNPTRPRNSPALLLIPSLPSLLGCSGAVENPSSLQRRFTSPPEAVAAAPLSPRVSPRTLLPIPTGSSGRRSSPSPTRTVVATSAGLPTLLEYLRFEPLSWLLPL